MTQTAEVLIHLRKHGTITPKEAWATRGIYRLGARIFDLRRLGHVIETQRAKGKAKHAIYKLVKEARR